MTAYLTEQEQIDLLKQWIKQYALSIITGILIAALAITGWRYWQQKQAKIESHASAVFDEMLTYRDRNNLTATTVQAQKLLRHYPKTVYGQMAALILAREAVRQKDYAGAEKHLQWVLDHAKVASLKQIARLRLARLMLIQGKAQQALSILHKVEDKTFNGLTNEIRGDAYLTLNQVDSARQSYRQALNELPNAEMIRPLLQMKYDNLL